MLARRPEAVTPTIDELLTRIKTGRVRIPVFQRPFQWNEKDVRLLLDSIVRGYPIGTLLFWKRSEPARAGRVLAGPHSFLAPEAADAWWVVDGQQRLTSLAGALLRRTRGEGPPEIRDLYVVAYDLAQQALVTPRKNDAWKREWLPMERLADEEDFLDWLDRHRNVYTPEQRQQAIRLSKAIRQYSVPAYVVASDDEQVLAHIFNRTNTSGKPLKKSQIFDALHRTLAGEGQGLASLESAVTDLGFGSIDSEWLLKVVVAVAGQDMTRVTNERVSDPALAPYVPRAAAALRNAIVFIQEAGVPHESLLPYRLPIVILAQFFDRHPEPGPRSRVLLKRWFWRAIASDNVLGRDVVQVRWMQDAIGSDEEESIQALLRATPRPDQAETSAFKRFDRRSAATRLVLLAMADLQPRSLVDGRKFELPDVLIQDAANAIQVFEKADPGAAASLGARIIHSPMTLSEIRDALLSAPEEVLRSHAITDAEHRYMKAGDWASAVESRVDRLAATVHHFVQARTGGDDNDRPSIDALIIPDEA